MPIPDFIGRTAVPNPTPSGLTFPLKSDWGCGIDQPAPVIEHRFGSGATLSTQRFFTALGPKKFKFVKASLSFPQRSTLLTFYNAVQGPYQSFTYNAPNSDGSTTAYSVVFDTPALSITNAASMCKTGITFLQIVDPSAAPTYTITETDIRFPGTTLTAALLSQVQQLVPMIHIKVRNAAVPDIYLSDRRCNVNGFPGTSTTQVFLPRVLSLGEDGSDVIMSQSISTERGAADRVSFIFGNADRVMSQLTQDCGLKYAEIDLSLFHVGTSVLLQVWKGTVQSWTNDGSPRFTINCSDALYPVQQQFPPRTTSRQCWKTFDDGNKCPYLTQSSVVTAYSGSTTYGLNAHVQAGGVAYISLQAGNVGNSPSASPTWWALDTCDFFFNSPNGCLAHGMSPYFGGQPAFPQSVVIKDNGTGVIAGFGRSVVTSTSIVNDGMYSEPIGEIYL